MINQILLYVGAAFPLFWGIAHLFPTKSVVKGFGDISLDNRRIITMEWIIEGVSLIFIGILTASVTYLDHTSMISRAVYWLSFGMLPVHRIQSKLYTLQALPSHLHDFFDLDNVGQLPLVLSRG
jgi:hypothetical protein